LRRKAQLLAQRPDLVVSDIRGNVDTRLSKLAGGSYDALVVAWAGLQRLGRSEGHPLSFQDMVPAAGQGCLVCEARSDDSHILELCAKLTDPGSQAALTAERALTARLGASCDTPIGAHAATTERGLCMTAFVGRSDGTMWVRDQLDQDRAETSEAEELGDCVAGRLLACGASEVLASQSTPMR
jgi:hydroxymethylbilane synthase